MQRFHIFLKTQTWEKGLSVQMVRVNNSLWGTTDGGFESSEEKAENKNAEIKMTIWTILKKQKKNFLPYSL